MVTLGSLVLAECYLHATPGANSRTDKVVSEFAAEKSACSDHGTAPAIPEADNVASNTIRTNYDALRMACNSGSSSSVCRIVKLTDAINPTAGKRRPDC